MLDRRSQTTNNVTSGINTLGEVGFKAEEMRSTPEYVFQAGGISRGSGAMRR